MDHWINLIPAVILVSAAIVVTISSDWRFIFAGYTAIYVSAFMIVIQYWSFGFSLVKLITGLMSLVVLGISVRAHPAYIPGKSWSQKIFHVIALLLVLVLLGLSSTRISNFLSIPTEIVLSSLAIIGFSLVQLGMMQDHLRIFLSILVLFFGFELIFSANESSLLVNGLLSAVCLLVAFMGSVVIQNEYENDEA